LLVFSKDIYVAFPADDDIEEQKEIPENLKSSNGVDRSGKVFTTINSISQNLYINREQSSLNIQPSVFIPNYYLSRASMNFENITAINFTNSLEDHPSEIIWASEDGPTYIYQKFSVLLSQFINNASIFIQDLSQNPIFTDENSWEVAVVNCSDDSDGTPNSNETLGILQVPHPTNLAAQWLVFDFKSLGDGPIFLNTSKTKSTIESGLKKYWFALRIKIPANDEASGGGPKLLYFNPDGGDPSNKGAGDTFIDSEVNFERSTISNVVGNRTWNGTLLSGGLDSFKNWTDGDRYLVEDDNSYVNITNRINFNNLTNSDNISYYEIIQKFFNPEDQSFSSYTWWANHYKYIFSIDLNIATNISNTNFIENATLYGYNWLVFPYTGIWVDLSEILQRSQKIELNQTTENLITYRIRDPVDKLLFLTFMHSPHFSPNYNRNNTVFFRFEYHGTGAARFNVSIGQFSANVGELDEIQKVHPSDPVLVELDYANNITLSNATTSMPLGDSLEALEVNDSIYYKAQADTNNLTVEFNLNVLNNVDSSFWAVDFYDWLTVAPNPRIPLMYITIISNTSIDHPDNITLATLELFKGTKTNQYLNDEQNAAEWLQLSRTNRTYLSNEETTEIVYLDPGFVWILLQFLNESDNNLMRMRLRFQTNETEGDTGWGFTLTIEEFSVRFQLENAISSDILTKIGFGLNSGTLKPEDIEMKNFGLNVTNGPTNQSGIWDETIPSGIPDQGIFEFEVTSLWNEITFDVSGTYEIYKLAVDIEFDDKIKTQYMSGTNYFSVEVTDSSGDPIEDLEIKFELLDSDGKVVDDDTAITNDEGIAKGALDFKELGEKYTVKVSYGEEGVYASEDIESRKFRIVDDFTLFMDTFQLFLPYILIGVAAFSTFAVIRHRKMSKLREQWAGEALILDDLLKISYIMVIHKIAGTTIYNKQISMELDSDLIGGFLTAISQFRSEIQKPKEKSTEDKGFQMDYYDFKIIIHDGSYIRVALILEGIPSDKLEISQRMFTERFESRFSPLIKDFSGDIRPFSETDALIEEYFNTSLMYPFQLGSHWDVSKLEKLERALLEVAEQMQKERNFFFVSSLLSYGLAGRKESRDQIISTIIDLKNRGLIVPMEVE